MGSSIDNRKGIGNGAAPATNTAHTKNYFAYHGGGKDPNMDSLHNCVENKEDVDMKKTTYLKTKEFLLKLNGQSRHLDGNGIDRKYLMDRLMPMLHSGCGAHHERVADTSIAAIKLNSATTPSLASDFQMLSQMKDRKEIYVYPFALNPEGANPSGSVNFSKVSHAKLTITVEGFADSATAAGTGTTSSIDEDFVVDVYGVYYNWLAIKDGRALTSFA